jgi:aminoglycoside phosphotransferase (APT) family kinase protein
MFKGNRLTGIVDWEMSCIGRPECDLAQQMISNRLFADPAGAPGSQPPSEEEWVERYVRAGGKPPENLLYFRRLAAFIVLIAVYSLQRSMDEAMRSAQRHFMDKVWTLAET